MYLNLVFGLLVNVIVLLQFGYFFSKDILKKFIIINFIFLVSLSFFCFFEVGYLNEVVYIVLNNWINLGFIKINLGLFYDSLTMTMVLIVIFISSLVHLYSFSYMKTDPYFLRFIGYLSLFTFFMLVLVTANNYLQLLIGWEGVGLSSYLLICFWYTRISANLAAIKAMLINRIGDVCLIIVICIFLQKLGSVSYGVIFNNIIYLLNNYVDVFFIEVKLIDIICLLLLLGAMGKSAQIILHVWLPDAMEGYFVGLSLNFTVCWNILRAHGPLNYLYNFSEKFMRLDNQQETKVYNNDYKLVGSSETTSEKFLNFYKFDNKFIEWFIGFFEGDGSLYITPEGYLEFKITQSSNDVQVLFFIKKTLGFGSVQKQSKLSNTHYFRVRKKEHIFILINLLNGNLFLKKNKNKFNLWVNAYNFKFNSSIIVIQCEKLFSLESAWLMGFLEAEGCFTVTPLCRSINYMQVKVRFILSQKNEKEFFEVIQKNLGGKLSYLKSYDGWNLTLNLKEIIKIINYVKMNKMYSKKKIEYIRWLKIYNFVIAKKHINLENKDKLLKLYKNWKETKI